LLQSNQFDTTWSTANGASVTSGQSGYDGSSDAWTLETQSGQTSRIIQNTTGLGSVNSLSVYAKANTLDWIRLQISTATGNYVADFDLTNGVSGYTFGSPLPSIQSIGSGWYRVTISGFAPPTQVRIYAASGNNNLVGAGTILIQSAQLEKGLVASSYLDSGATTAKAGVLVDLPRINYDANGENGALLLEPSRQNLFSFSEYITGFGTSNTGVSIEENATTSPEGVVNAAKIKEDATNAAHAVRQLTGPTLTSGTDYTFSFFAKKGERSIVALSNTIGASNAANCFFDLENGQVLTNQFNSASIEDFGNGWYRCIATDTADAADDYDTRIYTATADNQFSHQGVSGSGLYIYGIQLEAGNYVSSYIPTMGTSETRAADRAQILNTTTDVLSQTTFTLFFEADLTSDTTNNYRDIVAFRSSVSSNSLRLETRTDNSVRVQQSGMITSGDNWNSSAIGDTDNKKFAMTFTTSQVRFYADGSLVSTYNGAYSNDLNHILFSNSTSLGVETKTNFKQYILFSEALTDAECITLTTL